MSSKRRKWLKQNNTLTFGQWCICGLWQSVQTLLHRHLLVYRISDECQDSAAHQMHVWPSETAQALQEICSYQDVAQETGCGKPSLGLQLDIHEKLQEGCNDWVLSHDSHTADMIWRERGNQCHLIEWDFNAVRTIQNRLLYKVGYFRPQLTTWQVDIRARNEIA